MPSISRKDKTDDTLANIHQGLMMTCITAPYIHRTFLRTDEGAVDLMTGETIYADLGLEFRVLPVDIEVTLTQE